MKQTKYYKYNDHNTGDYITIEAIDILEADKLYKSLTGIDPSKRPSIGCEIINKGDNTMSRMPLCKCGKGYFSIEDPKLFVRRCNVCGQIERPERTVILGPEPNKYDPDPWRSVPMRE